MERGDIEVYASGQQSDEAAIPTGKRGGQLESTPARDAPAACAEERTREDAADSFMLRRRGRRGDVLYRRD